MTKEYINAKAKSLSDKYCQCCHEVCSDPHIDCDDIEKFGQECYVAGMNNMLLDAIEESMKAKYCGEGENFTDWLVDILRSSPEHK